MPPEAVTGVNGVAAMVVIKVVLGTACVVVSGASTFRVAEVPATPVAAPVALGVPVGMVLVPDVLPVTSTLKVQDELAASEPPNTVREVAPADGVNVPQLELEFGTAATTTPAGRVTLSATPANATPLFGLVRVYVSVLVPPIRIVSKSQFVSARR